MRLDLEVQKPFEATSMNVWLMHSKLLRKVVYDMRDKHGISTSRSYILHHLLSKTDAKTLIAELREVAAANGK